MGDFNATQESAEENDTLVSSVSSGFTLKEGHCSKQISGGINKLRERGRFCDLTVKVGGESFPVHKIVLAGFSPYFMALISEDPFKSTLKIDNMEAEIFEIILDYAYLSSITVHDDYVEDLLRASTLVKATPLIEACAEYLGKQTNDDNFVEMKELATEISCSALAEHVNKYARRNFSDFCHQVEFLDLEPEQLIDIIKSDDLEVKNEETVFKAVLRWIYHEEERESLLPKVLVYVRLAFVSSEFLRKCIQEEEIIRTSPICKEWIAEVLLFKWQKEFGEPPETFTKPRCKSSVIEGILVCGKSKEDKMTLLSCNIDHEKLVTLKGNSLIDLPRSAEMASVVVGSSVYLLLAVYRNSCYKNYYYSWLWHYDCTTDCWKQIDSSLSELSFQGLVESGGFLYVTVAKGHFNQCADMKRFDIELNNSWSSVAKMPTPLWDCALVAVDNMIYTIGGSYKDESESKTKYTHEVQRYDPQTNTWTKMTPLPEGFGQKLLCCAFEGKIYVIDGTQNNNNGRLTTPQVYDIGADEWEWGESLNRSYLNPAALMVLNGLLTFIDTSRFPYLLIERFSTETESWIPNDKNVKLGDLKSNFHIFREAVKFRPS